MHSTQVKVSVYVKERDVVIRRVLSMKFPRATRKFPSFPNVILVDLTHFEVPDDGQSVTSFEKGTTTPYDEPATKDVAATQEPDKKEIASTDEEIDNFHIDSPILLDLNATEDVEEEEDYLHCQKSEESEQEEKIAKILAPALEHQEDAAVVIAPTIAIVTVGTTSSKKRKSKLKKKTTAMKIKPHSLSPKKSD
ncbi:hypothetical protein V6N13_024514 [Hibiscus sabdariffa]|uniref:Uncharacterized protein n=1 Tax=Hibiscus sabdariffa TaxID=183260 RepID=A0ABR2NMR7_9ROSI